MKKQRAHLFYRTAKSLWHASGILRNSFIYLNRKRSQWDFYKRKVFFDNYLKKQSHHARAFGDSLLGPGETLFANSLELSQGVSIDFDKIKALENISLKLYEPGAFRIGNLRSKKQLGVTLKRAAWAREPGCEVNGDGADTWHEAVCLAIPRLATRSFALQVFDVFLALVCSERLRELGMCVETLVFDSDRDTQYELYRKCLPRCRLGGELAGVHHFRGILFSSLDRIDKIPDWRILLNACGKSGLFHRALLVAFGVPLPAPVKRVKTITLIRRKRKVLESGKPSGDRLVQNEGELMESLRSEYPQVKVRGIFLEELSLQEQFELLARSDILIGMHGAGLISGGYCLPSNAGMIELFPKYFTSTDFALTCRAVASERKIHYASWTNYSNKNEFGSNMASVWYERHMRDLLRNHSMTRVPPAVLTGKVSRLVRKIELARQRL